MSVRTRRPLTKTQQKDYIVLQYGGDWYRLPKSVAERYRMSRKDAKVFVSSDQLFATINKKYTRPGALLRGIRARENLTQVQLAKKLNVTQSDISQMESGRRKIGREIAKRIETKLGMPYKEFLE